MVQPTIRETLCDLKPEVLVLLLLIFLDAQNEEGGAEN
jgi:hypothetical protein